MVRNQQDRPGSRWIIRKKWWICKCEDFYVQICSNKVVSMLPFDYSNPNGWPHGCHIWVWEFASRACQTCQNNEETKVRWTFGKLRIREWINLLFVHGLKEANAGWLLLHNHVVNIFSASHHKWRAQCQLALFAHLVRCHEGCGEGCRVFLCLLHMDPTNLTTWSFLFNKTTWFRIPKFEIRNGTY